MKVLVINGSPKDNGNTANALREMVNVFNHENIEVNYLHVGNLDIRGCIGCRKCRELGKCVFDDVVNKAAELFKEADGIVVGSPVYYASANSTVIGFLTRLFQSANYSKRFKVGAAVAVARRSGTTATFDEINKFFTISQMPIASSSYWNNVYGTNPDDSNQDEEGLANMRILASNMVFLMKSIALGKEKYGLPPIEKITHTDFIR